MIEYFRGDIILANLDPTVGSEQKGRSRPCLIVSSNVLNKRLSTIIICPLTSRDKGTFLVGPVKIPAEISGLDQSSIVLVFQIRTIDKSRVLDKLGSVPEAIMAEISDSIREVLDLD